MDSVLDRIGTSDSDTSDKDYQRPTKKISLKAVVDALDNSPVKKPPSAIENDKSEEHITKIDFGLAQGKEPTVVTKPMPTLIPAPKLNRNNSNEGSNEIKPLPKIVKKEKFWEYEEIDEKPKEKRKRKLPNELARLQDTEEYMEANNAIKSDSTASERSKRPPRRAAILARENVNFLHGNVENGLELRGTRKALEKEKEDSFNSSRDSIDSDEEEKPDRSAVDNILANSDLFDADEASQPPQKEKKPPENDYVTLNLPPKPKKRKSEEPKSRNSSNSSDGPPISPRISRENLMNDMFSSQSNLTTFKIPKKKRDGDSERKDSPSARQKEPDNSGKSPKDNKRDKEKRKDRENGSSRPEKRSADGKVEKSVEKSEKRPSEKSSEKSSRKSEKLIEKRVKVETVLKQIEKDCANGQDDGGQQRWTQRVNYVRRHFAEWVKTLSDQRKNKLPK